MAIIPECYADKTAFSQHCPAALKDPVVCSGHDSREYMGDCNYVYTQMGCCVPDSCTDAFGPGAVLNFICNDGPWGPDGHYFVCSKPAGCVNDACKALMNDEGAWQINNTASAPQGS